VGVSIHFPVIPPLPAQPEALRVYDALSPRVALIKLFPGMTAHLLASLIDAPIQGLVLETFGSGNVPATPGLLETIERAVHERDLLAVAISQQLQGGVDLNAYEAGRRLADAGVVSGADMTPYAALVKLMFLLGRSDLDLQARRELMARNLRGELTPAITLTPELHPTFSPAPPDPGS
jgi:L-asparaginase/Glu-tRNA(Gln) amidotransferase subunit D